MDYRDVTRPNRWESVEQMAQRRPCTSLDKSLQTRDVPGACGVPATFRVSPPTLASPPHTHPHAAALRMQPTPVLTSPKAATYRLFLRGRLANLLANHSSRRGVCPSARGQTPPLQRRYLSGPREGPVTVRVGSFPLAITRGEQCVNSSNHPPIHPSHARFIRSLRFSVFGFRARGGISLSRPGTKSVDRAPLAGSHQFFNR
eukprot:4148886-Pyramimonas_sp.AAC.2